MAKWLGPVGAKKTEHSEGLSRVFTPPTWVGSSPTRRETSISDWRQHATRGATKQCVGRDPKTLAHFTSFHTRCERQQKTNRQHGRWSGGAAESSCGGALSQDPEPRWRVEVAAQDLPGIWGDLSPTSGGGLESPFSIRWVRIRCEVWGDWKPTSGGSPTEWSMAPSTDKLQHVARTGKQRDLFSDHVVNDGRHIRRRRGEFLVLT
jgi:hypothetical protein